MGKLLDMTLAVVFSVVIVAAFMIPWKGKPS